MCTLPQLCLTLYLSIDNCKDLNLVHRDFPFINVKEKTETSSINNLNSEEVKSSVEQHDRELPERPESMPYAPTEGNVPLLERWLLEKF